MLAYRQLGAPSLHVGRGGPEKLHGRKPLGGYQLGNRIEGFNPPEAPDPTILGPVFPVTVGYSGRGVWHHL